MLARAAEPMPSVSFGAATPYAFLLAKPGSSGAITIEAAEAARDEAREEVADAREREDWNGVAEKLRDAAEELGDPVLMLESADARYSLAAEARSVEEAQKSIETARVALDILYFYQDVANGEAETRWLVVDPDRARELIDEADERIAAAQSLIEELEASPSRGSGDGTKGKSKVKDKPDKAKSAKGKAGTGLIATGATFTAIGIVGIGVMLGGVVTSASRQRRVEQLDPAMDQDEIQDLDAAGRRANFVGIAGGIIAGVGLVVGIPCLAVGVKRRNAGPSASARVRLMPELSRTRAGLVLTASF